MSINKEKHCNEVRKITLDDPYAIDAFSDFNQIKDGIDKKQKRKIADELEYIVRICKIIRTSLKKFKKESIFNLVLSYESNIKLLKEFLVGRISLGDFLINFQPIAVPTYKDIEKLSLEECIILKNCVENLEESVSKISHHTGRYMTKDNLNKCIETYTYVFSSLIGAKGAIAVYKRKQSNSDSLLF